MSQQKNDINFIILCAGKGSRLSKKYANIPKPMIKVKIFDNIPIIRILLEGLIKQQHINKIYIILGHLGYEIKKYLKSAFSNLLNEKILLIDASEAYEKGPLFSLFSILSKISNKENQIFAVIPGDTFYDNINILEEISINLANIKSSDSTLFYKEIYGDRVKKLFIPKRTIKAIKTDNSNENDQILGDIEDIKIELIPNDKLIKILLPLFVMDYEFIHTLRQEAIKKGLNKLSDVLKSILKATTIKCIKINSVGTFFDIDTEADIEFIKKKYGQ